MCRLPNDCVWSVTAGGPSNRVVRVGMGLPWRGAWLWCVRVSIFITAHGGKGSGKGDGKGGGQHSPSDGRGSKGSGKGDSKGGGGKGDYKGKGRGMGKGFGGR